MEEEDTETNRELRVNTGLLGRAEEGGTQIILTALANATEVPLALIARWAGQAAPMISREPRLFSIPKWSAAEPQRVAITIDTITSVEFIRNLTESMVVKIGEGRFAVSFEYHQGRTLILSPDKLNEGDFKLFMAVLAAMGLSGA